jgi:uncharacterized membrane protein YhaH (DUF805 family)
MSVLQAMIGFDGRLPISLFWQATLVQLVVMLAIMTAIMSRYSTGKGQATGSTMAETKLMGFAGVTAYVLLGYPSITVMAKRLHDMDFSGWWVLPLCLPSMIQVTAQALGRIGTNSNPSPAGRLIHAASIVGMVIYVLWLGFVPGTAGPNRFGAAP